MRKISLLTILLLLVCVSQAQEYRAKNGMPGPGYWQNKPSYNIKADFNTQDGVITASESVTYTNNSPQTLTEIVFNLYENYKEQSPFEIRSIRQGKKPVPEFKIEGTKMTAKLKKPLASGASVTLNIDYTFSFLQSNSSHNRSGKYEGNYFVGYWYPQIAVYDDNGWDMVNHTGTEEFYYELADYDVDIKTHDNYYVYASVPTADGAIPDYKANADNNWHFIANGFFDFSFAASKDMEVTKDVVPSASGEVQLVIMSRDGNFIKDTREPAKSFIRGIQPIFSKIAFPYKQIVLFDNGRQSGGMEFPGMVNLGIRWMDDGSSQFVVCHELAHQYAPFVAGFNQAREGFMDEGFAMLLPYLVKGRDVIHSKSNYVGFCYMEMMGPTGELDESVNYTEGVVFTPSYLFASSRDYNSISYHKSFLALYMMREVLGADKFGNMINDFFAAWAGKHPKAEDFLNAVQTAYGDNLDWFINPWYYQPKRPDLSIAECGQKDGKYFVKVRNDNGIPVPVKLIVGNKFKEDDCGFRFCNDKHFYFTPEVWKSGDEFFTIEFDELEFPFFVRLGCDEIPDQTYNSLLEFKSEEDFGPIVEKQ